MNNLLIRFSALQQREKNMLTLMSAAVLLTLLYLLLWEPVFKSLEEQQLKQQSQKKILLWMTDAQKEVQELRSSGNTLSPHSNQPISTLVERSAISSGIRNNIYKINSDKKQQLKVQFKSVEFDRITQWLAKLQNDYGVMAKFISINKTDKSGMVSCRVTLQKLNS